MTFDDALDRFVAFIHGTIGPGVILQIAAILICLLVVLVLNRSLQHTHVRTVPRSAAGVLREGDDNGS